MVCVTVWRRFVDKYGEWVELFSRQTDRQTDRRTDRQTDRQTDKQTDRDR